MNTSKHLLSVFLLSCLPSLSWAESCRIGLLLPLTGPLAEYGVATRNGIELANEELQNPPQYIVEDNKYDAATAISAYRSVKARERVDFFYNWGELPTSSLAPATERNRDVVVTMSMDSRPTKGTKFILRTLNPSSEFVATGLQYLKEQKKGRLVVFIAQDPFFEEQFSELKRQSSGADEVSLLKTFEFSPSAQDFRSGIVALKGLQFDTAVVYLNPGQVSNFAKQFRALGFTQTLFGTDIFESQTEIDQAEGGLEGSAYVSLPLSPEFKERYVKRYSNDLQVAYALNAYRMGKIIAKSCEGGLPKEPESIVERLMKSASVVPGVAFVRGTDSAGYFQSSLVLRRIQGSKVVE